MPGLRDVWPEWKDDDRWWIKPYDDRVRPEEGLDAAREHASLPPAGAGK